MVPAEELDKRFPRVVPERRTKESRREDRQAEFDLLLVWTLRRFLRPLDFVVSRFFLLGLSPVVFSSVFTSARAVRRPGYQPQGTRNRLSYRPVSS